VEVVLPADAATDALAVQRISGLKLPPMPDWFAKGLTDANPNRAMFYDLAAPELHSERLRKLFHPNAPPPS
jgi:hypothetical protein